MQEECQFRIGSKFSRLTVSSEPFKSDGYIRFECDCDCGNKVTVKKTSLRSGNTRSCGCLAKDVKAGLAKAIDRDRAWKKCSIDGCENDARSKFGAWCEKHYYRNRRKRSFDDPEIKGRLKTDHGYILVKRPNHPIAQSSGMMYEHREVLYNSLDGNDTYCHWCKRGIVWVGEGERIVVDHLDNNKENNEESNLVASCHKCNSVRGLFMKWVYDHIDDPFLKQLFEKSNTALMECR